MEINIKDRWSNFRKGMIFNKLSINPICLKVHLYNTNCGVQCISNEVCCLDNVQNSRCTEDNAK